MVLKAKGDVKMVILQYLLGTGLQTCPSIETKIWMLSSFMQNVLVQLTSASVGFVVGRIWDAGHIMDTEDQLV